MPTNITIATFNCENLFKRYKFSSKLSDKQKNNAVEHGFILDRTLFETIVDEEKSLTAKAIKATKANIVALQEVENLDTLKSFNSLFLKQYPYKYLIDGNDPRLIDVGVLSTIEANGLNTHQYDKIGKEEIFSRDCLEVEFNVGGVELTLFINHFKSMIGDEQKNIEKRKRQSQRVVDIIKNKFGNNPIKENFIVLGDFNDHPSSPGIKPLLSQKWLENVVERLPIQEQWTHYFDKEKSVAQLDYILLSQNLSKNNSTVLPQIIRQGICKNAIQYKGKRFDGVGASRPSASDHCPISININI